MPYKKEYHKKWRDANKDKIRKYAKSYYDRYPETMKLKSIKNRYGVSKEEYYEMLEAQEGKCGVCKQEKILHVDHCHDTNRFRGLLCNSCNTKLGWAENNLETILEYIGYEV